MEVPLATKASVFKIRRSKVGANWDTDLAELFASELDAIVIGVDYRLAPEHKFPAPLEDCSDALDWVWFHCPRTCYPYYECVTDVNISRSSKSHQHIILT